jgi:hypothetical protein
MYATICTGNNEGDGSDSEGDGSDINIEVVINNEGDINNDVDKNIEGDGSGNEGDGSDSEGDGSDINIEVVVNNEGNTNNDVDGSDMDIEGSGNKGVVMDEEETPLGEYAKYKYKRMLKSGEEAVPNQQYIAKNARRGGAKGWIVDWCPTYEMITGKWYRIGWKSTFLLSLDEPAHGHIIPYKVKQAALNKQ